LTLYDLFLVLLLLLTLVVAALSASAETALTSVSRIRVRHLVEEENRRAALIEKLHREPNDYLTAILTANTTAIVISSTAAGLIAANHGLGAFWPEFGISLVDAAVVLVFAEVTAKSLALGSLRYALWVAPAVNAITTLLRPGLRAMSGLARLIGRVAPGEARGPFVTEEELKMLVSVGEEEGIIEEEEREMIHGIIEIGDMSVREVMIPRIDIVAVDVRQSVREVVELIIKHGHSRIPVYEESIDRIIGLVYAKDLLRYRAEGRDGDLRSLLRPAQFVPENKKVWEMLQEMRTERYHMAIVVDEFGQTAGLVTLEDVIEEIVGPIRDEYDTSEEEEVQWIAPNEVILDARVSLADARDLLGMELAAEDVDYLGGFIYSHLDRIPRPGEVLEVEGKTVTVLSVRGQRIGKLRVRGEEPFPGSELESAREASEEAGQTTDEDRREG
jgi:CBS domain containing-hemolysin-like protein